MPGLTAVALKVPALQSTSDTPLEKCPIALPSLIPASLCTQACSAQVVDAESRIREALCRDSLNRVRYLLRVKTRMIQFKFQNLSGQREGVRSRAVIDKVHERVWLAVTQYRACRASGKTH